MIKILITILIFQSSLIAQYWSNHQGIKNINENPKKAQSYFLNALEKESNDSRILYNLGNSYNKANEFDKSISAYSQALQNISEQYKTATHYNLGTTALQHNKLDLAIEHLSKALKRSPNFEKARQNLEIALEKQAKEKEQSTNNSNSNSNEEINETPQNKNTDSATSNKNSNTQESDGSTKSTQSIEHYVNEQEKQARQNFVNRLKQSTKFNKDVSW